MNLPISDLVETLNNIMPDLQVTKLDFQQPKPARVEQIYYGMLIEFGVRDRFHTTLLDGQDGSVPTETQGSLVLVGALMKFFRDINHPEPFGMFDLYKPEPKRLKRFLGSMVNAWNFCNSQIQHIKPAQERVADGEKEMIRVANEVNNHMVVLEELKRNKEDEAKKQQHLEHLTAKKEGELKELTKETSAAKQSSDQLKTEKEELQTRQKSLDKEISEEEALAKRMKELLHAEEVQKELEEEINAVKYGLEDKRREKHSLKKKMNVIEEKIHDMEANIKQIEGLKQKHSCVQSLLGELKDLQQWNIPEDTETVEELERSADLMRKKIADIRQKSAISEAKFARMITQKKNELEMLRGELETASKGQSDKEQMAIDLLKRTQELESHLQSLEGVEQQVRDLLENEELKIIHETNKKLTKIYDEMSQILSM